MAAQTFGELRQELQTTAKRLADIGRSLDLPGKKARIAELEEQMSTPSFWDDQDAAQKVIGENNALKGNVERMEKFQAEYEDLEAMLELAQEEKDDDLFHECDKGVEKIKADLEKFELELLLSDPYDKNNAILELHPGAGGTESQDWASMLYRMYTRWAEQHGYKVEVLDYLPGEEAGIKSVTILVKGYNAFGYLKAERGVHRLVRISPFDASGRRHTSFSSVDVIPEIDDSVDIEIREVDLKIDTYRASGAGGQHINTTDSAVRITHIPSGVVVTSQAERSQIKNRAAAMKVLQAKLYELERKKQEEELAALRGEQKDIGWGSQIRSYVFHPYSLVKDHRTNTEIGNVHAVMDGELDPFIDAFLRKQIETKTEE
ncbi:peptide chain release factor 2 [Tumebacillus flagellatus]|nr:peptide chain release factor 2 [Tumebacillus flagellatus]